jgi:hypothetical protein
MVKDRMVPQVALDIPTVLVVVVDQVDQTEQQ